MNPTISVIIPTYKPQGYLWECLDSIDKQTLDTEAFEVIVVLNGDRDPYYGDIAGRLKNYRFSYRLLYATKAGVSRARNLGLEASKGDYVCFMDDDDWVSDSYLAKLLASATTDGIAEANVVAMDEESKRECYHYLANAYGRYDGKHAEDICRNRSFMSSACCKIIPKAVIDGCRFAEGISHGEDSLFMFSISKNIKRVSVTEPGAIYYVRKRNGSASRNKKNRWKKKRMECRLMLLYTTVYLKHPLCYNLPFYATRLLATVKKLLRE